MAKMPDITLKVTLHNHDTGYTEISVEGLVCEPDTIEIVQDDAVIKLPRNSLDGFIDALKKV